MTKIQKVVVTGGPRGGKSKVSEAVVGEFGERVVVVPELATALLTGGFPLPGRDLEWNERWQDAFQAVLALAQPHHERAWELAAGERGVRVVICDRGLLDGAAYTPGGVTEFCRRYDVNREAALTRYALVFHLESTATGAPEDYTRDLRKGNVSRFEPLALAAEREYTLREAWRGHPKWTFLPCAVGIEGKIRAVCQTIRAIL